MSIDPITGPHRRPVPPPVASRPATSATPAAGVRVAASDARRDSVEISAEGRELAALDADRAARILVVQARIKQQFYSSPAVQREVARRVLGSGDL